jgi:hypothetical protein
MLSMKVRKRHSWRWAAVAVLIALLVLGLGFVLRSVGPSTPAALPSAAKGAAGAQSSRRKTISAGYAILPPVKHYCIGRVRAV